MITDDLPIDVPLNIERTAGEADPSASRLPALPGRDFDQRPNRARTWLLAAPPPLWSPPTDVVEFGDRLVVWVEVAGMREARFQVTVRDRRLIVTGQRPRPALMHAAQQVHRVEIGFGDFQVEVSLPWPVMRDQAAATYQDGFLCIELPRAQHQQVRIVDVDQDQDSSESPQTENSR